MSDLFEFRLPDIGEGVAEGEVVQWSVKEGDAIGEDQEMVEVMTDKATVPLSSPVKGTIKEIVVQAGEVAPVGAVLCRIAPAAGSHVPTIASHGASGHGAPAKAAPKAQAAAAAEAPKAAPAKPQAAPAAEAPKAATAKPLESQKGPRSTKASELPQTPKPPGVGEDTEEAEEPVVKKAAPAKAAARQEPAPQEEEEPAAAEAPAQPEAAPAPQQPAGQHALATPYTRRLAREHGLDIDQIEGSGEVGRVTEQDVQRAAEAKKKGTFKPKSAKPAAVPAASPAAKPAPRPAGAAAPAAAASLSEQVAAKPAARPAEAPAPARPAAARPAAAAPAGGETRVPIRGLRKRISERMHQSKTTAAHFTYVDECDVTELVKLRTSMKERAAKRGVKLTYLPFIAKALVSAFQEFPTLNGVTDDAASEFVVKHYFNFGIAVDTDNGLIVPVVKNVDQRSLLDLAAEMDRVAGEARDGKSKLEDLKDGTFTITNAGNIGGLFATPIINYPEAAILGVHAIKKRPMVVEGEIQIRDVMYLSISIDHRMNDGATGARFMNHVIGLLQDPSSLLLEM